MWAIPKGVRAETTGDLAIHGLRSSATLRTAKIRVPGGRKSCFSSRGRDLRWGYGGIGRGRVLESEPGVGLKKKRELFHPEKPGREAEPWVGKLGAAVLKEFSREAEGGLPKI